MTSQQKLMLFLISCDPGVKGIYKMVMLYNRAGFPMNSEDNLQPLLDDKLIFVSKVFDNKTPSEYEITSKGETYLKEHFNETEILDYIKSLQNPDLLFEITKAYIDKKKKTER